MERSTESHTEVTPAKDRETILKYKIIKELIVENGLYYGICFGLVISFMTLNSFATPWLVDLVNKHFLGVMLVIVIAIPRLISVLRPSYRTPADWETYLPAREIRKLNLVTWAVGLVCGFLPFAFVAILLLILQGHL